MHHEVRIEAWKECFSDLADPRVVGRMRHSLINILFLTLSGVTCGMDGWEAIEEWGQELTLPLKFLL